MLLCASMIAFIVKLLNANGQAKSNSTKTDLLHDTKRSETVRSM